MYKNKFIAYSLGNFLTYGRFNLKGSAGIAPIIKILVSKDGNFMSGEIFSIKQIEKGIPVLDNDKKALKEIIELTNSDIINNNLVIELNGKISKKN